jgi:molybdopterin molybdotransferase
MIPVEQALSHVIAAAPRLASEVVELDRVVGRVLNEDITAPHDYPPFNRVMMDGYGVRASDLKSTDVLPVVGEAAAGTSDELALSEGTCALVMTGAPLPKGADSVVPVEETHLEGDRVRFSDPVRRGQHVAVRGEEAKLGDCLLAAGNLLTPVSVATIVSVGRTQVLVGRLPSLAMVTTGDELVPVDREPGLHQIRDSNSWSLTAQAAAEGLTDIRRLHARDDEGALESTFREALTSDIVIISGGVSAGKYDLVPGVLDRLGVKQIFHKVFAKPGKPLWFGSNGSTLVFGAPGNPLSTVVTFQVYVRAAIAVMAGRRHVDPRFAAVLERDVSYRSRRDLFAFVRGWWEDGGYRAMPLPGKGSADVFAPATANALLALPAGEHHLRAGQAIEVRFLGPSPGVLS